MYVNNTNTLLLIYNVYIYDYSFGDKYGGADWYQISF